MALLWLAAAAVSGFTLRRYISPLDEGALLQAVARMGAGEWPWRDFTWAYGPGEPLAVLALAKLFGPSLLWWRLLRVAADATAAVLVWALVRDQRPRWALPAWAAAAVTAAQPTSANPTAPALAFALAALLLATRGRPAWAGLAAAAAALWRPDMGAVAALAAATVLALGNRAARHPAAGRSGRRRSETAGEPTGGAARRVGTCLLAAAVAGLVAFAPFALAAGIGRTWSALVVDSTRDGAWWRLPFPDGFGGGDAKDFLTWLLPYAAIATLALSLRRATLGLALLGAGALVYFTSRADLEHAQSLLVLAAALAALVRPKVLGVAVLALLLAVGIGNRAAALLRPPDLKPYAGVRVPPEDADALPRVVALVDELVPPGEPIYVAPRRSDLVTFSNPLLHYFTDRPNVLHRDVLLQAKPDEQRKIVAALRRVRPKAVIRWTAPESAEPEPNRRGRPSGSTALDDYLAASYALAARFGDYDVLVPR